MPDEIFSLRRLSVDDRRDVYDFLQSLPEGNGFTNDALGLPYEAFPAWLKRKEEVSRSVNLDEGFVPQSQYWLYVDGVPVGQAKIRHRLNDTLRKFGGNIGYGIAPAHRDKGYATRMLRMVLAEAKKLGIERALITINPDNLASRRVAEKCGGMLEFENEAHCYYWIDT